MTLQHKIDILFLIAVLIFSTLFYSGYQSSHITHESSRQISQAQQVLYSLEKVESGISRIEAANRGFIITGKDIYLAPVEALKEELSHNLQVLDTSLHHTSNQSDRLHQLNQLIAQRIELSTEGVQLKRNKKISASLVSKGKALMDSIFSLSNSMEREEFSLLNKRISRNEAFVGDRNYNYLIFSGFTAVLLLLVYLHIRKNTAKLFRYRQNQDELIEELNYQNRQLDDFAHLTSHNIRSPAVNLFTLINLLNENSSLDDYKFIFDKLSKVSKNLNETLNELIEVLQVKSDTEIEHHTLQFEDILRKVKESMEGDIMLSQAQISSNFSEAEQIQYPKAYLESIFHNLLSNAIKYCSPERLPRITISTRRQNNNVLLEITDNGLGIDMERYGHQVFGLRKIFHRKENARGIGLFMTKTQVEALGGNISLQSEVGKGSIFTITFNAKNGIKSLGRKPTLATA